MRLVCMVFLFVGSYSFADVEIQDGIYDSNGFCSMHVLTDQTNGNLIASGIGCEDRSVNTWTPYQANEFRNSRNQIIKAEDIKKCAPTRRNKTPCYPWLYDNNGKFVAQIGDQLVNHYNPFDQFQRVRMDMGNE